jgi:hypothetical protein
MTNTTMTKPELDIKKRYEAGIAVLTKYGVSKVEARFQTSDFWRSEYHLWEVWEDPDIDIRGS